MNSSEAEELKEEAKTSGIAGFEFYCSLRYLINQPIEVIIRSSL